MGDYLHHSQQASITNIQRRILPPMKSTTSAEHLLNILRERHKDDVFVAECKNGSTTNRDTHSKIDAWCMKKSWSRPLVIGYEIKVVRRDFIQDTKWMAYLSMCNELYFVAPKGIISVDELPEHTGLMELTQSRLITRRKAAYRDIQIPEDVFRYILMCRATIGAEQKNLDVAEDRLAYWRKWAEQSGESLELGHRIAYRVRQHIDQVQKENERLQQEMARYDDHRRLMEQLGFTPARIQSMMSYQLEHRLKKLEELLPEHLVNSLTQARDRLGDLLHTINFEKERK